ncbi:MAG: hypothetical protein P8Z31_02685 [Gammaproteobacteria bacterium]
MAGVMIIRCTKKLLKELRIQPVDVEDASPVGSWHANLLHVDRRKCAIVTHDLTLFTLFMPGLRRAEFDRFDDVFGQALFRTMRLFDFEQRLIECMLDRSRSNLYTTTNDRSVLGSMNDMAFHIRYFIDAFGGLSVADLDEIATRINRTPFKAIGFAYPSERFADMLDSAGCA